MSKKFVNFDETYFYIICYKGSILSIVIQIMEATAKALIRVLKPQSQKVLEI